MLKYSIFSEHYIASRAERKVANNHSHNVAGNLALSTNRNSAEKMPISRGVSRTWWESGWQNRK